LTFDAEPDVVAGEHTRLNAAVDSNLRRYDRRGSADDEKR
jgi:hypothetical protein